MDRRIFWGGSGAPRCRFGSSQGRSKAPVGLREGRVNYRTVPRSPPPPRPLSSGATRRHRAGPRSAPPRTPFVSPPLSLILFMHFCKELWDAAPPTPPVNSGAIKNPNNGGGGNKGAPRRGTPPTHTHAPPRASPRCRARLGDAEGGGGGGWVGWGWWWGGEGRGCCHLPELPAPRVRMPALSLARGTCRSARAGDVTGGGPVKT